MSMTALRSSEGRERLHEAATRSFLRNPLARHPLCLSDSGRHLDRHSDAYVLDRHTHIDGIENFWNQAKRTLSRYKGIPKAPFPSSSKRPNFASTTEHPASNFDPSNAGPNLRPSQSDLGQPPKFWLLGELKLAVIASYPQYCRECHRLSRPRRHPGPLRCARGNLSRRRNMYGADPPAD